MTMRQPKKLVEYLTAEKAAAGLRELAERILDDAPDRPLVKWSLQLWFWNPRWATERSWD